MNSSAVEANDLTKIRRRRVIQISAVTAIGLFASLLVARGVTYDIFLFGIISLALTAALAYKHYVTTSSYLLLSAMSSMLFALAVTGAGAFDIAMLGYPGVIIFAALLGGRTLFGSVLSLVILQCVALTWLIMHDIISPNPPNLTWSHVLFIIVIFVVTGFSVFILVQDIRRLMQSLQQENAKVEKNREYIHHLAHHDPLTNLPNRIKGEQLFNKKLLDSEAEGHQLALLFIDLDNFKPVNDALGHAAGDRFLQKISQTISDNLTSNESLIRFGGDEFIVLASHIEHKSQIDTLGSNIVAWCATEFELLRSKIVVSSSVGVALAPKDGTNFKQLCRKADVAMYEAKRNGRSRVEYYDVQLDEESDEKFTLLQRLRPAVKNNELEVYYQPLVNLNSGEVYAAEALLRWPQKDNTTIFPDKFISIAENSGLINKLGAWVLNEACAFCARQQKNGHAEFTVAVNLSFVQFKDGLLPSIVERALERAQLAPQYLELELTETILAEEGSSINQQLESIKLLGVQFAIDDFGTGYSNLSYLRRFSARKLKVDRAFVHSLGTDNTNESLVLAIINIAKSLGMQTVAEGIENKATLEKLKELGCEFGQGFYWSKPITATETEHFLSQHRAS